MYQVSSALQPEIQIKYPPYTENNIEHYFLEYFKRNSAHITTDRIYLPVMWTHYYIQHGFGQHTMDAAAELWRTIDKSKKYYTIIQYDDGILNKPADVDILVFAAGGDGHGHVPIPLLADNMPTVPDAEFIPFADRKYLASFVGSNSHPIREHLSHDFKGRTDCIYTFDHVSVPEYFDIMRNSMFSICPRGYGATSYRLYEAIHCLSIPLYITDKSWFNPYFCIRNMKALTLDEFYLQEPIPKKDKVKVWVDDLARQIKGSLELAKSKLTFEQVCHWIIKYLQYG